MGGLGPHYSGEELRNLCQHLPEELLPEALQHLGASHNARLRHQALAALSPRLGPELLRTAIVIARQIGDTTGRVKALNDLLPYLSTPQVNARVQEVLVLADQIEDPEEHAEALAAVSHHIPPDQREDVCAKVLGAIHELKGRSGCERALTVLAPILPNALLARAMQFTQELPSSEARVRAVMALSARLVAEEHVSILRAELLAAQSIANGRLRLRVFEEILDFSPESFVMEVVNAARNDPAEEGSESLLMKAVPRLTEPDRSEVVKAAWRAAVWGSIRTIWMDTTSSDGCAVWDRTCHVSCLTIRSTPRESSPSRTSGRGP
jgi:hypothetical protein